MTQTNAERQRLWRERMKSAGYHQMVVWLPQEAVDILASYPEKERGQVILNALRNVTSNIPITIPGNELVTIPRSEAADTGPPALLNRFEVLEDKVERLTQAVQGLITSNIPITIPGSTPITIPGNDTHHAAKAKALSAEELARTAQSLHAQGLSYSQIAEQWKNEKIPTLRGGGWHRGTVNNLVRRYCQ
jgi:Recombinase